MNQGNQPPSLVRPDGGFNYPTAYHPSYAASLGVVTVSKTRLVIAAVVFGVLILGGIAITIAILSSSFALRPKFPTTKATTTKTTKTTTMTTTTTTTTPGTAISTITTATTPGSTVPFMLSSNSTGCGRPAFQPFTSKIVGGEEAVPHSWPWMALLRLYDTADSTEYSASCDGVLVANQWVITAAHCTSIAKKIEVLLGVHDTTVVAEVDVESTNIFTHPSYSDTKLSNDIGAIKLPAPVAFSSNIRPACMPDSGVPIPPDRAYYVTGWGLTTQDGDASQMLMQTQLPVIADSQCRSVYPNFKAQSQLCAAWQQGGRAPCQGDSGGPLVRQQSDGAWVVVGLVSYADGCAVQGDPDVFSDVSFFRSWLDATFKK